MFKVNSSMSNGFYPEFLDDSSNPAKIIEETIDHQRAHPVVTIKRKQKIFKPKQIIKRSLREYYANSQAPFPPVVIYK